MVTDRDLRKTESSEEGYITLKAAEKIVGVRRKTIKYWCENKVILKSTNQAVRTRKNSVGYWEIDKRDVDAIRNQQKEVLGGREGEGRLLNLSEAARCIEIKKTLLRKYTDEGIPLKHLKEDFVNPVIRGRRGFGYDGETLSFPSLQYLEDGDIYLGEEVVWVLMLLNEPKIKGWLAIKEVAETEKERKHLKHLCHRKRIKAGFGLNGRQWLLEPSQFARYILRGRLTYILDEVGEEAVNYVHNLLETGKPVIASTISEKKKRYFRQKSGQIKVEVKKKKDRLRSVQETLSSVQKQIPTHKEIYKKVSWEEARKNYVFVAYFLNYVRLIDAVGKGDTKKANSFQKKIEVIKHFVRIHNERPTSIPIYKFNPRARYQENQWIHHKGLRKWIMNAHKSSLDLIVLDDKAQDVYEEVIALQ